MTLNTRKTDIHHHAIPGAYREWCSRNNPDVELPGWSPEQSLAFMDENGLETAWLSLSDPGIVSNVPGEARSLAKECNKEFACFKKRFPGKFKAFGTVPFPDIPGSIQEIRHCLDTLQLDGIILFSNTDGVYPSASEHRVLFEELNKQKALVFLHPAPAPGLDTEDIVDKSFEYPLDVSTLFARFVTEGLFEDFEDIRFIFAHGGALVPFLIDRIGKLAYLDGMKPKMGKVLGDMIRKRNRGAGFMQRNYFDLTGSGDAVQMAALNAHLSKENFLPGSNFPWASPGRAAAELRLGLQHCGAL